MDEAVATTSFTCPRCANEVAERFYGPCGSCRDELAAAVRGEARELETPAYVPKSNVVPNHVATRD